MRVVLNAKANEGQISPIVPKYLVTYTWVLIYISENYLMKSNWNFGLFLSHSIVCITSANF